ncbi:MAG: heme ABC transporter permease [Alphaproteobacteria bacterium]|nr:heme ABC transporter permease [Alphaproteobacteria bacterium]
MNKPINKTGQIFNRFEAYANPMRFMALAQHLHFWVWAAALALLAWGFYQVAHVPPDYQQGSLVRILFVHVPAAWMAMFIYSFICAASLIGLILHHPLAYLAARAAAPIGAVFTLIMLLTGALWGQPTWGVWWVWDARLTSALVLLFIYAGYMALWYAIEDDTQATKATAILAIAGFINIPIIKFSVDWWNTLHQPASIMRLSSPALDVAFLYPLLWVAAGFTLLFVALLLTRMQTYIWQQKYKMQKLKQQWR